METTPTKRVDVSTIVLGFALIIFLATVFIILGGWVFMVAWNAFMVPVFALATVDIWMSWGALVLLYLVGVALGFRRNVKTNVKIK